MRFVRNDVLGRDLSVLGFGAAAVMGRAGRRTSLRALGAALDAGINVFDTARSYGYGASEALLGEFLEGRREQVVITTKFGIVPSAQPGWKQLAKPLARAAMRVVPGIRSRVRSQVAAQFAPGQFTIDVLQSSIETSLRKLRTDHVDVLFMHDASAVAAQDEALLRAMEDLRAAGKVRMIGVSAEPAIAVAALEQAVVTAVQYPCNIGNSFAQAAFDTKRADHALRFANHAFGGAAGVAALRAQLASLASAPGLDDSLQARLASVGDDLVADVALNSALAAGSDVVLTTMMSPAHLQTNVAAVTRSSFHPDELAQVRACLIPTPVVL